MSCCFQSMWHLRQNITTYKSLSPCLVLAPGWLYTLTNIVIVRFQGKMWTIFKDREFVRFEMKLLTACKIWTIYLRTSLISFFSYTCFLSFCLFVMTAIFKHNTYYVDNTNFIVVFHFTFYDKSIFIHMLDVTRVHGTILHICVLFHFAFVSRN